MNILQKADEILEEYKELCEHFGEKQKPLDDFRAHYDELRLKLHGDVTKIVNEDEKLNESN